MGKKTIRALTESCLSCQGVGHRIVVEADYCSYHNIEYKIICKECNGIGYIFKPLVLPDKVEKK